MATFVSQYRMRGSAVSLALVCAIALTGCGGGEKEGEGAGAPPVGSSPAPSPGVTPAPTPGVTPAPTPGVTPAPTPGVTPAPTPGVTPAPTPSVTPAPTPGATPPPGQTDLPPLAAGSAELPLRRLTKTQYVNAMQDIARQALPSQGAAIAGTVPAMAASYPADSMINILGERHGGFYRLDQAVQQSHVDAAYEIASKLAAEFTTSARIGALMGACATDTNTANDDTCLRDTIRKVGRIAWRRPLTDAEVTFHRNLAGTNPVAPVSVADALTLLLSAPQVVYLVEHGQAALTAGRAQLTAHELAARLSFHFWQTIPDAELAGLADSGQLLTAATYQAQVARMAADAKTEPVVREFFAQWFRLHELEPLDSRLGDVVFDAFRGSFTPTKDSRQNAMNEIGELAAYHLKTGGSLKTMFSDKRSFARTADIASLYGVPVWDGTSTPPDVTTGGRSGLMTRVAFLATGSANTRPIMKGYRVRNALLCQQLPPPPAEAMSATVELSGTMTTREVVEAVTQKPGTSCVGCHTMMNPLGFVTENFDSLGRPRTVQRLFNAQGQVTSSPAVKTDGIPRITPTDARFAADSLQASQFLQESGEFERCFAQHYFRYTFGRREMEGDRAAVTDLMNAARTGASIRDLLARLALRSEFQSKMF
jgi:Protein of unknown function (DUF1592)/Protein of unknown function (DUF1588)/Protein of unknown function (DUF1585)